MLLKVLFALVLTSLCCRVHAQDASPAAERSVEADVVEWPSMQQVGRVSAGRTIAPVLYVRISWNDSGRVVDAKLDPPTRVPELDRAIRQWAKKVRMKPSSPGSGVLPLHLASAR